MLTNQSLFLARGRESESESNNLTQRSRSSRGTENTSAREQLRPLYAVQSLTRDRYSATFQVLQEVSREYGPLADTLGDLIRDYAPTEYSLLDIGAGNGLLLSGLEAKTVGQRLVNYEAVEPNPIPVRALKGVVAELKATRKFINQTEFTSGFRPNSAERFDVVLFSHSLYGMWDPVEALLAAQKLLTPNGIVVAFIDTPMGTLRINNVLEPYVRRNQPAVENFAVNSQTVVAGLRAAEVNFSVRAVATELDLTRLYDDRTEDRTEATFKRREFLSFFTQVEMDTAPSAFVEDAEFLLASASVRQDGRVILQQPTAAIVVGPKNQQ